MTKERDRDSFLNLESHSCLDFKVIATQLWSSSGIAMCAFLNFCQKHFYAGFVLFGIGGGIEALSQYLPFVFEHWISPLGLFIMVFSAIVLMVGLIMEGRHRKRK
jgi:hypothetical protein